MSKTVLWQGAWNSRGTLITTGFNGLSDPGNWTTLANCTQIDNSSNLDKWGKVVFSVSFPTGAAVGGCIVVYMVTAPDGTDYEDGGTSVDPGEHNIVAVVNVKPTVTGVQLLTSKIFPMQPAKTKFIVLNKADANMASTGNTMALYTNNESANN